MKRFIIVMLLLIVSTLVWLGIILNAAQFYLEFDNESRLIFKNVVLQFKIIYFLGVILIMGYIYMILSKSYHSYF